MGTRVESWRKLAPPLPVMLRRPNSIAAFSVRSAYHTLYSIKQFLVRLLGLDN